MIVKCPSCNSEFMVGESVFKKTKSPLFHCNICNVFFRISANDILRESASVNTGIGTHASAVHAAEMEPAQENVPASTAADAQDDTATEGVYVDKQSDQENEASIEHDDVKRRIQKIFSIKKNTSKKIRSQTGVWVWDYKNKEASREPHLQKVSRYIDDINFNPEAEGIFIDQLLEHDVQPNGKIVKKMPILTRLTRFWARANRRTKRLDIGTIVGAISNGAKTFAHSGILKIALFLIVPYAVLATICYAARSYEDAPQLVASVMSFNKSGLPEIAPNTLEILNIEQEKVITSRAASGAPTDLTMISGNIFNTDIYSFSNLFLELRTYDKHNRLLETSIVPLENELNKHWNFPNNMEHLDTIKILSMQQKPARGTGFKLRPNNVSRFQIIVSHDSEQTYYFSVRVYSVKKTMNAV